MNIVKRRLVIAGTIALSLLATACGSDKASNSTSAPVATGAATTTAAGAESTTTAAEAVSTEAPASTTPASTVDFSKLTGSLVGSGATFPKGFRFEGNRAIIFDQADAVSMDSLALCVAAALTYHRDKARSRRRTRALLLS